MATLGTILSIPVDSHIPALCSDQQVGSRPIQTAQTGSKPIDRTANAVASLVQHMGMNHGRTHILVPRQFLDGLGVVTRL
jgi:hypothetical protein